VGEFNIANLQTEWSRQKPSVPVTPRPKIPTFIFWTRYISRDTERYVAAAYKDIWEDIQKSGWSRKILLIFLEESEFLIPTSTHERADQVSVEEIPFTFISLDPLSDFCQSVERELESKPSHRPFQDLLIMALVTGLQG
jgi:hypothetical protein